MKKFIFLLVLSIVLFNQSLSMADLFSPTTLSKARDNSTINEVGILTSYGITKATDKDDYVTVPLFFRLGFDCDKFGLGFSDWIERGARDLFHKEFRPKGTTSFLMEPFLAYVPSPDSNAEAGFILAFKYDWPLTAKFHPYIWNGGGIMYYTQHLREQSTQWNFTPQIGVGFSYFISTNTALNFEYRYRHFSNANTKLPNDGMNQAFVSVGYSWRY